MKNNENNDSMLDKMTLIATLYYKDRKLQKNYIFQDPGFPNFSPEQKNSALLRLKLSLLFPVILSWRNNCVKNII